MPIYNDESSDRKFKAGYWYVTHRVWLRQQGILLLIIVVAALLIYGAWGIFNYYVLQRDARLALEQQISAPQLNSQLLTEVNQPKNLQILSTDVFRRADGKIDLISQVLNPNTQWAVSSFDYYFLSGDKKTPVQTDFMLPVQKKFATLLNYAPDFAISSPQLIIENIKWKKTANYQALADTVLNIEIANQIILSGRKSGASDKEQINEIRFDVINHSAYSFWSPKFYILLYRGDSLVGVSSTVLDSLSASEIQKVDLNIFQAQSEPTKFDVVPDINILDSSVFKGFGNEVGSPK